MGEIPILSIVRSYALPNESLVKPPVVTVPPTTGGPMIARSNKAMVLLTSIGGATSVRPLPNRSIHSAHRLDWPRDDGLMEEGDVIVEKDDGVQSEQVGSVLR